MNSKLITKDLTFVAIVCAIIAPFFISQDLYHLYLKYNASNPYILAFIKFAILATIGEVLALRLRRKIYSYQGFGIVPRAILWGLFGIWIAIAMKVFAAGSPFMVETLLPIEGVASAMKGDFTVYKLIGAFSISVMMNTVFAPVFMTLHKITDAHIEKNNGSLKALITPINMSKAFKEINWDIQWGFVFKKTIPFFWIPAHTITFILPSHMQVLFAALLGIALGLILAIAAMRAQNK